MMTALKNTCITLIVFISFISCCSQRVGHNPGDSFHFQKLVFHSSRCHGLCPQIDFEVDSNRNIILNLDIRKTKSETDESKSGRYKGQLESGKFKELMQQLRSSRYDTMHFEEVLCCDGPITTIIVYANNKRTYLKSMIPPPEASPFIEYLKELALRLNLPRTYEAFSIEE